MSIVIIVHIFQQFRNWSVSSVAIGLIQNLSEYHEQLSNYDHDLPLKVLQVKVLLIESNILIHSFGTRIVYHITVYQDAMVCKLNRSHYVFVSVYVNLCTVTLTIDYRSYQMSHCVSIPMIFVSAIFARLSRQMTRATLTAKMALTAKMRDCSRFMAWITLTAKMAANVCS